MNWRADDLPGLSKRVRGVSVQAGKVDPGGAAAAVRGALKYGNQPTVDEEGIRHDSKREAKRWKELRLLLKAGKIAWLARQVEFILPGGIIYRADFVYGYGGFPLDGIDQDRTASEIEIEDAKGVRTPEYKLKAKLMKERGFKIKEV